MKLFFNEAGQIDYDAFDNGTTLDDLLQAIDIFIDNHPLSCGQCQNGCCRKPWAVEVDNVSARRICADTRMSQADFFDDMVEIDENKHLDFDQYVMKKQTPHCPWVTESNRCRVYQSRPLICRLYTCSLKSLRYNQLREASAATFLQALVFEQMINNQNPSASQIDYYKKNPALYARDYSIELQKIIDYALEEGWI